LNQFNLGQQKGNINYLLVGMVFILVWILVNFSLRFAWETGMFSKMDILVALLNIKRFYAGLIFHVFFMPLVFVWLLSKGVQSDTGCHLVRWQSRRAYLSAVNKSCIRLSTMFCSIYLSVHLIFTSTFLSFAFGKESIYLIKFIALHGILLPMLILYYYAISQLYLMITHFTSQKGVAYILILGVSVFQWILIGQFPVIQFVPIHVTWWEAIYIANPAKAHTVNSLLQIFGIAVGLFLFTRSLLEKRDVLAE
jgi:hypothetical protein